MRKRTREDEQLPLLPTTDLHLVPHIASTIIGTRSSSSTSTIMGTGNTAGVSNIAGANNTTAANGIPIVVALYGASTTTSTSASARANYNSGASGSTSAI